MVILRNLIFLMSTLTCTNANYTLYELIAFNEIERSLLYNIHLKNRNVCFLNDVTNEAIVPMIVIVKSCCTESFENKLYTNNIQFAELSQQFLQTLKNQELALLNPSVYGNTFYDWSRINMWISTNVREYPALKKIVIAKTFENRDLFILKLSTEKKKIGVFIMGGESGTDWVTPAIILNLIKKLLEKGSLSGLTDYYNFYFLPFMNPDGYVYSKTMNIFWAKNKKKFIPQISCLGNYTAEGVNLDRNWHFTKLYHNLQDQECNAVYIGQGPLSEEETQALSYALNNLSMGLVAFVNLKGFNRLITIPYGSDEISVNHDILMELITMASAKINKIYNVTYYVGKSSKYIYNSSGNVADWVKKMLNTPVVYTVHLKHEDNILGTSVEEVELLTQHLEIILNETLFLAKDIYGPLYGKVTIPQIDNLSLVFPIIVIKMHILQ